MLGDTYLATQSRPATMARQVNDDAFEDVHLFLPFPKNQVQLHFPPTNFKLPPLPADLYLSRGSLQISPGYQNVPLPLQLLHCLLRDCEFCSYVGHHRVDLNPSSRHRYILDYVVECISSAIIAMRVSSLHTCSHRGITHRPLSWFSPTPFSRN